MPQIGARYWVEYNLEHWPGLVTVDQPLPLKNSWPRQRCAIFHSCSPLAKESDFRGGQAGLERLFLQWAGCKPVERRWFGRRIVSHCINISTFWSLKLTFSSWAKTGPALQRKYIQPSWHQDWVVLIVEASVHNICFDEMLIQNIQLHSWILQPILNESLVKITIIIMVVEKHEFWTLDIFLVTTWQCHGHIMVRSLSG